MASFDNEHTRSMAIALGAATVAWFFQPQAHASIPQILGLVATAEPTPLNCADGTCSAAFSSFCMEQMKATPQTGTEYRLAEGSDLTLVYTDAQGAVHETDAAPYVDVDSARRYAAVRISLSEDALNALGATDVALKVGAHASAVPAALADHAAPISLAKLGRIAGSLRDAAARLFDPDSDTAVAAATAIKLENASAALQPQQRIDVEALWRQAIGPMPGTEGQPGLVAVAVSLKTCRADAGGPLTGAGATRCLQHVHDLNMSRANVRVWDGLAHTGT